MKDIFDSMMKKRPARVRSYGKKEKPATRTDLKWDRLTGGTRRIVEQLHKKLENRKPGGMSTATVICPFCQRESTTLMRTLAAAGKRCECTALHTGKGFSFKWGSPNAHLDNLVLRAYIWGGIECNGTTFTGIAIADCVARARHTILRDCAFKPTRWGKLRTLELDSEEFVMLATNST